MRIILRGIKPYAALAALSVLLLAAGSAADLMMPNLMSTVVNDGIVPGNTAVILRLGVLMLGAAVLSLAVRFLNGYVSSRVAAGMSRDLRADLFRRVQGFSSAETLRFGTASLITRTTTDVAQLQNFVNMFLRMGVTAPIMAAGGAFMAFGKSPTLAGVLLVMLPVLILSVLGLSRLALPVTRSMLRKIDRINLVMREKLTGVRVIRAFGTEDYEQRRFDGANRDLTETALKMSRIMSGMHPLMTVALNLASITVLYMGALEASYGGLPVGDIMAVIQYVSQILGSAMLISMAFVIWPRTSASAGRIGEVLDTESEIADGTDDVPEGPAALAFNGVSFRYPGADRETLENVSFSIEPGRTTAIIGSTGSGKSTLLSLLLRFYDPTEGSVTLGGRDIRSFGLLSYRARLGYVPQRAVLFSGTAAENIRMGRQGADGEALRDAAETACAAEFIDARDGGFAGRVEQNGANLSGGQKQRLSIARAVVRRPQVYIFDDSFSALDYKTDRELRARLAETTDGAAVLIVAQRVSTIRDADRIVVLDEGRVAGVGTHTELLAGCRVYREIVLSQLSAEEAAGQ